MVDIHTHILYGVDDGSSSIDVSKYLLDEALKNNINKIILTPHQNEELKRTNELIELFNQFKNDFKNYNIDFYLGSEIYYYPNMIIDIENNELLTMNNSKYILVEFSTELKTNISDIVYDLNIKGYIPIVAHIERYNYLNFDDYKKIKSNGGLIQVNTSIFKIKAYKKILKFLLKNELIDFISSDCHNEIRNIDFSFPKKIINKKYNNQYDKLFNTIPEFIK